MDKTGKPILDALLGASESFADDATKSWLWPDRVIGKRESRRLREEHNALVNRADEMARSLVAMKLAVADAVESGQGVTTNPNATGDWTEIGL